MNINVLLEGLTCDVADRLEGYDWVGIVPSPSPLPELRTQDLIFCNDGLGDGPGLFYSSSRSSLIDRWKKGEQCPEALTGDDRLLWAYDPRQVKNLQGRVLAMFRLYPVGKGSKVEKK